MSLIKRTLSTGQSMKIETVNSFVSVRPEENDKEKVVITSGNLLYNTETEKFLTTTKEQLFEEFCWKDQSAYFIPSKNTGHTDEEKFNGILKFVTPKEATHLVIVPATIYRLRKTIFRYNVFVETNFKLAFTYVKFLQEEAHTFSDDDITRDSPDPLNPGKLITVARL